MCRVVEVLLVALGSEDDSLASIECDFTNLTTTTPGPFNPQSTTSPNVSPNGAVGANSGKAKLDERKINEEVNIYD